MTTQTRYTAVVIADASIVHHNSYDSAQERCDEVMDVLQANYDLPELQEYSDSTEPDDILHDSAQELLDDGLDLHLIEDEVEMPALASPIHSVTITSADEVTIHHAHSAQETYDYLTHRLSRIIPVIGQIPFDETQSHQLQVQTIALTLQQFDDRIKHIAYAFADTPDGDALIGTIIDQTATGH